MCLAHLEAKTQHRGTMNVATQCRLGLQHLGVRPGESGPLVLLQYPRTLHHTDHKLLQHPVQTATHERLRQRLQLYLLLKRTKGVLQKNLLSRAREHQRFPIRATYLLALTTELSHCRESRRMDSGYRPQRLLCHRPTLGRVGPPFRRNQAPTILQTIKF